MAVSCQVVRFQKDSSGTTNATQDVSLSFTPKAIIVFSEGGTADNSVSAQFQWIIGFSDGTNHSCCSSGSVDASAAASAGRYFSNNSVFVRLSESAPATTTASRATCTFATNKVTFTWAVNDAVATRITLVAYGGSDITNVKVNTVEMGRTTTGTQDYTGLGFTPADGNAVLFTIANALPTATVNTNTTTGGLFHGAAVSTTKRWVAGTLSENISDPSDTWRFQSNANCVATLTSAGAAESLADFNGWISDGFQLDWTDPPSVSTQLFAYLVIKGGNWDCDSLECPASTGNQNVSVSVSSTTIRGLVCAHVGHGTGNIGTIVNTNTFHQGATDGTTTSMISCIDEDAQNTTDSYRVTESTNLIRKLTIDGANSGGVATFTSFGTNQFSVNWSTVAATTLVGWVVVADATAGTLFTRSITESSISVSDSNARLLTGMRTLSESSISASDSNARTFFANRVLSDTVTVSDARARLLIATRALAEPSISVSDSLARLLIATRTRSETVAVSDSLARLLTATRTLSEPSISVSDSLTAVPTVLVSRSITEPSITVSDSVARSVLLLRSLPETVAVSDSLARLLIATRTITESTISVLDSLARTPIRVRSLADTVTVSDSLARMTILARTLSEPSITVSDARARLLIATRLISEPSISVSDSLARTLILVRAISEAAISVSDSLARSLLLSRSLSDTVTVSDSLARRLSAFRTLAEPAITVSDSVARQLVPNMILIEPAITVSDVLDRLLLARRTLSDTITISDSLNAARLRVRLIAEAAITVSDSIARRLLAFRVIGETVFVVEVLAVVGPDYEVALYISDRGYSNPLRARIQFISRNEPYPTFYTYDSFNPDARPFNIVSMSVRLAQGEIGGFSMTIEDSAGIVDKAKIGLGVKVVVEVRKEFATPYFKLITGFVRRIKPLRPATGALLYQIDGYGSQVVFNERVVNFRRAAKRAAVDSTIPLSTDSQMQAHRLFSDLITATDILPLRKPTIQSTGGFELTEVSPEVTDFIAQIAPGLTDAATVANALAEITGSIWGTDANGNPFFRYPTQKHSGILVKDAPVSTDLAASTSVNLDAFQFDDSIDVSEGFANRIYVLNAVDTKSTASSSKGQGSTTLTTRGIAQQWTSTDNNVTSAAFILSRVGNPITESGSIPGKLRADNNGYPTGATLATFEIPISSIETSRSTIFVNDIKVKDGTINPGQKYWWYLLGTGLHDDSNTVRWHHDNDLSTPDRLSATLPLVDKDPTKPGTQAEWIRNVFGPVYAFSTFSSVRHILTQSDSESIKQYGLIEGIVDLPAFDDDATFQKALAKIIYTSAKPKRTYEYNRLTIPTRRLFYPGEMITVIDSKASLTSEKNVNAEIAEVNYNFDTSSNGIGCKYVDIRLIAFLDKALDDYMDTREC